MVLEVTIKLVDFIVLFVLFLIIFSILTYYVMNNDNLGLIYNADDGTSPYLPEFLDILLNNFLLSIGMGSNDEAGYGLLLFIIICITFIIMLLNLLIAVVGETYEIVQEKQVAY